jgi:Glutathione S-transferase, N-terminal domain
VLGHLQARSAARRAPLRQRLRGAARGGWDPEVEKTYGWGVLPDFMNPTRAEVRELTGQGSVPVLVTDDGEVITDSKRSIAWARANPAAGAEAPASPERRPG